MLNYEKDLDTWHEIIDPGNLIISQRYRLMKDEIQEFDEAVDFGSKIKEACDVLVTAYAVIKYGVGHIKQNSAQEYYEIFKKYITKNDIDIEKAMKKVFDSNMSKFVLKDEVSEAMVYFDKLGIEVYSKELSDDCFAIYSLKDQTSNKKDYMKDKLLKGPKYQKIDESKEWWN